MTDMELITKLYQKNVKRKMNLESKIIKQPHTEIIHKEEINLLKGKILGIGDVLKLLNKEKNSHSDIFESTEKDLK